ncbi:activator protein [Burkholderia sp. Ac-20344]|uniref:activator protein n=1 Tax=Burkholderia sp. Ac-20344 TaxID=2703890 RepID=UPI00197C6D75|nr:activator protein [Burkholderia sp. Ac-20344]MBN3835368.1 activator protein [Burkholderia sp. Ac-20344]
MNIRQIASLAASAGFAAVSAAPAFAVTVSRADGLPMNPNGEPFSASGLTTLHKGAVSPINCTATFNGTVTPIGIVNVTSTQFAGGALCGLITGSATSATPWTGQVDSTTQVSINDVKLNVIVLGTCGPSKVPAAWIDRDASVTLSDAVLTPDCTVDGRVATSPRFHVQ